MFKRWTWPDALLRAVDAVLALGFLLVAEWDVWVTGGVGGPRWLNTVVLAFVAPPLFWRRSHPLGCVAVMSAAIGLQAVLTRSAPDGLLYVGPILIGAYSLGAYANARRGWLGLACLFVALPLQFVYDRNASDTTDQLWAGLFWYPVLAVAWLVGWLVRSRLELARDREESSRRAAEQRRVLDEERRRIARELHDVLAHSVSLMGVQAAAAERVMPHDPARARQALETVQQMSRESVAELRRLLSMLRPGQDGALCPQPHLGQLDELVEQVQRVGVVVRVHRVGDLDDLPPGLALALYRVVQEALTNALKHTVKPAVDIVLQRDDQELSIRIRSAGQLRHSPGSGHGLLGMRERITMYDGELDAGPVHGDSFLVHARVPLTGIAR